MHTDNIRNTVYISILNLLKFREQNIILTIFNKRKLISKTNLPAHRTKTQFNLASLTKRVVYCKIKERGSATQTFLVTGKHFTFFNPLT